jgi:hypothetical protein
VRDIIAQQVTVTIAGKKRQMTLLDALLHRIFTNALGGDAKAIPHALTLARMSEGEDGPGAGDQELEEQRLEVLRQLLRARSGGSDERGGQ